MKQAWNVPSVARWDIIHAEKDHTISHVIQGTQKIYNMSSILLSQNIFKMSYPLSINKVSGGSKKSGLLVKMILILSSETSGKFSCSSKVTNFGWVSGKIQSNPVLNYNLYESMK